MLIQVSWHSPFGPQQRPPLARPSCHIPPIHLEKLQTNVILCFIFSKLCKQQQNPKNSPLLWPVPENHHGRHRPCGREWAPTSPLTSPLSSSLQPERPRWGWPRWNWSGGQHGADISNWDHTFAGGSVPELVSSPHSWPAFGRQEACKCSNCSQSSCKKRHNINFVFPVYWLKTRDYSDLSPSSQFDRLVKPPFIHGLLHQLCLQRTIQPNTIRTLHPSPLT